MTSESDHLPSPCRHPAVTLVTFCPCLLIRGLWTRRVHLQGTDGKTLHCLASLIYLRSDLDPVDPSFPLVLYSLLCFGCILNVDNVVSIPSLPLICQHFVARSPGRQARAALDLQHHPTFPSSFNIFQHLSTSFNIFQRFKAETSIQYFVRRGQDSILIERAPCRSPSHPSQSVPFRAPFRAVQSLCKGTMRLAADYPVTRLQVPL